MKKFIFVGIMVVFNLPVWHAQITSKKGYAVYHFFNNYD